MTLRLRNRWLSKGGGWLEWSAFIDDEGSGELERVDHVEYVLHPTFPNPIRKVNNPRGGFALETAGWGIFDLKAFVHMKDGKKEKLTHTIELSTYPPEGVSK